MPTTPQNVKIVELLAPATDAAGRNSDILSLKNYRKATIVVHITQGNAATVALTPYQCTDVSGTGAKVVPAVPIWSNLDTATSDAMVKRTDAANYTTDAAVKNKVVVFQLDSSELDADGGFDCFYISTGASNVANITQAMAYLEEPRFAQASLPSAIIN